MILCKGESSEARKQKQNVRIVDQDINIAPLLGQVVNKAADGSTVANVELHRQDLDLVGTELLDKLVGNLAESIDTASRQNQAQATSGRSRACKLEGSAAADAGGGAGNDDGLAGEALSDGGHCAKGAGRRKQKGRREVGWTENDRTDCRRDE